MHISWISISAITMPKISQALCQQTQHCWPTTSNIVARCTSCIRLHILLHVVANNNLLLCVVEQSLKPVKIQLHANGGNSQHCLANNLGSCCVLRYSACSFSATVYIAAGRIRLLQNAVLIQGWCDKIVHKKNNGENHFNITPGLDNKLFKSWSYW